MNPKYDIRRTIKITKQVTGQQIADALKTLIPQFKQKYAAYVEQPVNDVDGIVTVRIGIKRTEPFSDVIIRTGSLLTEPTIVLAAPYQIFGVSTWLFDYKPWAWNTEQQHLLDVEEARDGIEKILQLTHSKL